MNFLPALITETASTSSMGWGMIIFYVVIIGGGMYFLVIRPQKKQQRKQDELMNSLEVGDTVITTAGFYGVIVDNVDENVVIIEFGNNKNCRIPVKKTSITEVEKAKDPAKAAKEEVKDTKDKKDNKDSKESK